MSKSNHNPSHTRSEIAARLERFAEFLETKQILSDAGPIYNAASQCRTMKGDKWGYRIERLVFHRIGEIRIQSHPIKCSNISVEVSVDIEGNCYVPENTDPLTKLSLDLLILSSNGEMSSWHLDRVIDEKANFSHPDYHFQFGGKNMKFGPEQYGSVLITDTPRIPHPPMDGVLGIDFVIVNFWDTRSIKFRYEGGYANILKPSIDLLWKPYIETIYGFWLPNGHLRPWKPNSSWHQLLPRV